MAVTAFPVILVDSTGGGSDTAASGAGPTTALTGTAATTDGAGTLVTLDGSPDLSGVATDGSHVLYYHDTTAGARRFSAINAVDDGAKTVTVEQALAVSHGASTWGIGGTRLTLAGTDSLPLFENNSGDGDCMPGWTVEMQSGHVEVLTASLGLEWRRAGDLTDGPMTLRGESGAATRPVLQYEHNTGTALVARSKHQHFESFDIVKTGTADSGTGFADDANFSRLRDITIEDGPTYQFSTGVTAKNCQIINSRIYNINGLGVSLSGSWTANVMYNSEVIGCTTGVNYANASRQAGSIIGCIIAGNSSTGLVYTNTRTDGIASGLVVMNNVFFDNGGSGLLIGSVPEAAHLMFVANNIFKENAQWGVKFTDTAKEALLGALLENNGFDSNTSGSVTDSGGTEQESVLANNSVLACDVDNASFGTAGDYSLGSASDLLSAGFGRGGHMDIGAVQGTPPASGGGPGPQIMRPLTGAFPVAS